MKIKQTICAILALVMLFSIVIVPSAQTKYSDVPEDAQYIQSLNRLSQLGIVNGYGDGTFKPSNSVTRAEFSKILVTFLGLKDNVTDSGISGVFTDVPSTHWANGYINLVYKQGYITGYGDGSFKPDDNINFAEAVTLVLRTMGYTSAELGYHWPSSYIAKAQALGLTEDMQLTANDAITRADMAVIFDRALFADTKSGRTMFELLGYTEIEDVTVLATRKEDASLAVGRIKTTSGTYKLKDEALTTVSAGDRGSMYLNDDGEVETFYLDEQVKRRITIDTVIDKEIYGYENGAYVTVAVEKDLVVYSKGAAYSLDSIRTKLTNGSAITLIGYSYGDWDLAILETEDIAGPQVVFEKLDVKTRTIGSITFADGVKVYRQDKAISLTDLDVYDVIYYVAGTNTIYAYNDRETGTYDAAYPNRAQVTDISLSGTKYSVGTKTAISKLNADGDFDINDKITVLLGMNGEVVDVVSPVYVSDYSSYAVVTDAYTQVSKEEENFGKLEYYTVVVNLDGKEYTYKSEDDYSSHKGYLCQINFKDGLMYITGRLSTSSGSVPSGYIDTVSRTIGDVYVSPDVKIIEVNSSENAVVKVAKVAFSELGSMNLGKSNVIYCERDSAFGDITVLVLKDFTNNTYDYGYVSKKTDTSVTIDIDGVKTSYSGTFTLGLGAPVRVLTQGNKILSVYELTKIASATKIEAIDDVRIKVDGSIIYVAEDVKVYKYKTNSTEKEMMTYDELKTNNGIIEVLVYSDKALANGAKARVIVVSTKN